MEGLASPDRHNPCHSHTISATGVGGYLWKATQRTGCCKLFNTNVQKALATSVTSGVCLWRVGITRTSHGHTTQATGLVDFCAIHNTTAMPPPVIPCLHSHHSHSSSEMRIFQRTPLAACCFRGAAVQAWQHLTGEPDLHRHTTQATLGIGGLPAMANDCQHNTAMQPWIHPTPPQPPQTALTHKAPGPPSPQLQGVLDRLSQPCCKPLVSCRCVGKSHLCAIQQCRQQG